MNSPRRKLLLFELHHLGDAVMSLPFVRAAAIQYEVSIVCSRVCAGFFSRLLGDHQVLIWDSPWTHPSEKHNLVSWYKSGIIQLIREIRSFKPDIAASIWADARVLALMLLSGAPQRVGFPMCETNYYATHLDWRIKQLRFGQMLESALSLLCCGRTFTCKILRKSIRQHHMDNWLQLAAALDISVDETPPWLAATPLNPGDREWIEHQRSQGKTVWLLHPGARFPIRRLPLTSYQALCDSFFSEPDKALVIIAPPGEDSPTPCNGQRIITPPNLAVLESWIANVDCVLCNDSLAAHLAAAHGTSGVVIFSAGSSDWFRPRCESISIIENHICKFRPCLDKCQMPTPICLEAITVNQVEEQCRALSAASKQKHVKPFQEI